MLWWLLPEPGPGKKRRQKKRVCEAAAIKSATESSFACRRYSAGSVEYGRGARRIDIHWRKREAAIISRSQRETEERRGYVQNRQQDSMSVRS